MKTMHWALLLVVLVIATAVVPSLFADQIVAVPESHRFEVVSQQILDSGAKLVIIKDTKHEFLTKSACYAIYEAGVGAVLGQVAC